MSTKRYRKRLTFFSFYLIDNKPRWQQQVEVKIELPRLKTWRIRQLQRRLKAFCFFFSFVLTKNWFFVFVVQVLPHTDLRGLVFKCTVSPSQNHWAFFSSLTVFFCLFLTLIGKVTCFFTKKKNIGNPSKKFYSTFKNPSPPPRDYGKIFFTLLNPKKKSVHNQSCLIVWMSQNKYLSNCCCFSHSKVFSFWRKKKKWAVSSLIWIY